MSVAALIKKARASFFGHVVFLEICWGLPLATFFIWRNYIDGALTLRWTLWCLLVSAIAALGIAVLFWLTMGRPLLRRQALAEQMRRSTQRVKRE